MHHYVTLTILGLFVAFVPFLGFPPVWDRWLSAFIGIIIAAIAFFNYKRHGFRQFISFDSETDTSLGGEHANE